MSKLAQPPNVTVQSKLSLIIVAISTISLLLAATLFTLFQLREHRSSMIESLTSVASITADNAQAAIHFKNKSDADNIVAEFRSDSQILTAAIYTGEKKLFSAYDLTGDNIDTLHDFSAEDKQYTFDQNQLHLYQAITFQGSQKIIGYIYLRANLDSIYQQLKQNVLVIAAIVLSVLFIATLLTSKLQKIISDPILDLSQVTRTIKRGKDFSIRVYHNEYLEVYQLCDGFNSMLDEIQTRDKHLQRLALYDELTGIPNRSLFINHFNKAIAHSKRTKTQLAICFLDIDNFKPINDDFGHEVGDKLLIEVANRITDIVREEDTVSRQGGDEFAILLGDLESHKQYEQTLERIHYTLSQPYLIDSYSHRITASSGITLYPSDVGDIDTLIRHADQAMYHAKLAGKHRYHLFNPQHDKNIIQKHHRLSEIEHALNNNQLSLFYQPKVNMATGEVFGAEALLRWIHPEQGLIPPLAFLPVIEGSDLESQIGEWVINQALLQLSVWQSQNIYLEVSVNISSHHLQSETFLSNLKISLAKHPSVDPKSLQLEILESSALGEIQIISNIITICQNTYGVGIALDDFGTGYSSLTHLRNLPADTIKIDQSFVIDMLDNPSDFAIVDGVIALSDSFNRSVIAEGVETTEHGLILLLSSCNEAQGYGIARPMPATELPQWLANYTPNQDWLRCGSEHRSIKENKIKLLKLIINHWQEKFIVNIMSPPEKKKHWPIMGSKDCSCCDWLKRAKQEELFNQQWLNNINVAHEKVHHIANDLYNKYEQGEIDSAREDLVNFNAAFDEVNELLTL